VLGSFEHRRSDAIDEWVRTPRLARRGRTGEQLGDTPATKYRRRTGRREQHERDGRDDDVIDQRRDDTGADPQGEPSQREDAVGRECNDPVQQA